MHKLRLLISERTGYPSEMLGLDLNLESDLGIDSIKRVEVLVCRRLYLSSDSEGFQVAMEKLASVKTLGGIVDLIAGILRSGAPLPMDAPLTIRGPITVGDPSPSAAALLEPQAGAEFRAAPLEIPLPARSGRCPFRAL